MPNINWAQFMQEKPSSRQWGANDTRVFVIVLLVALLAKGAAMFRGTSVDDYRFSFGLGDGGLLGVFLSQGRYVAWLVVYVIDAIGVNLNDTYFTFAFITIVLQSALVVSVIRFVGYSSAFRAALLGGIMVLHPYFAEILTFKVILPVYSLALVFTIIAIESANRHSDGLLKKAATFASIAAAIMTYQASFNYLLVAAFGAFLMATLARSQGTESAEEAGVLRTKAFFLLFSAVFGALCFLAIVSLSKHLGLVGDLTGRAKLIGLDQLAARGDEVLSTLHTVYIKSEPVFSGNLKLLFMALVVAAVVMIVFDLTSSRRRATNVLWALVLFGCVPVLSLGLIIPFRDWWPVPRVLAHVSLLLGLLFLIADRSVMAARFPLLVRLVTLGRVLVLSGFVLINNQIFADQQKVSQWDRFQANRIVERLEGSPHFDGLRALYVDGGRWGYPVHLRTLQGDMNTSAFYYAWAKLEVISEASGYAFGRPGAADVQKGSTLCKGRKPWPQEDSVFIDGDLGVVCLPK